MAEDPFAAAVTDVSMLDPFAAAVTDATLPHCAASPREVPEADVNTADPSGAPNAGHVAMTPPGKKDGRIVVASLSAKNASVDPKV